jgi:sirohydrochlorin ferrochelatase
MRIALVDNGSLEPAAHESLRAAALAIGERAHAPVEAVSWKHSGRIPAARLHAGAAQTLAPWIRAHVAAGERDFVVVPFFVSPEGSIGSALAGDIEALRAEIGPFTVAFSEGLSPDSTLPAIMAERIREAAASLRLRHPSVVVVDHGGPSMNSALIRNRVADGVRDSLGGFIGPLVASSMESPDGPGFDFNRPLFAEALAMKGFNSGSVLVAPLFLSPGRHAGPAGDLRKIARGAEAAAPGLRCHFTQLIGTHPKAIDALAGALARVLRVGSHS